jgi:hypothetical protein
MKLYDVVKQILEDFLQARSSDKFLIWEVWRRQGFITQKQYESQSITETAFLRAAHPSSIIRLRAMIQSSERKKVSKGEIELKDSLLPLTDVQEFRDEIQRQRGTHVFREDAIVPEDIIQYQMFGDE